MEVNKMKDNLFMKIILNDIISFIFGISKLIIIISIPAFMSMIELYFLNIDFQVNNIGLSFIINAILIMWVYIWFNHVYDRYTDAQYLEKLKNDAFPNPED